MPVKGMPESVEVYELTGAAPVRTRLQVAAARGLTRFVGRWAEIDVLTLAFEHAATGQGQVVALVGEPGVGKSRLVWEFTHSHRTQGWLVLESRSVSYGKATAYRPVIDLLRTYFEVEDRDDGHRIRAKVVGKLLRLDEALKHMVPAFLALLDVTVDDPEWLATNPPLRRRSRMRRSISRPPRRTTPPRPARCRTSSRRSSIPIASKCVTSARMAASVGTRAGSTCPPSASGNTWASRRSMTGFGTSISAP